MYATYQSLIDRAEDLLAQTINLERAGGSIDAEAKLRVLKKQDISQTDGVRKRARLTKSFPAAQTLGKQTPFVMVLSVKSHLPVAMQTCFFASEKIVPLAQMHTPCPSRMRPTAHVLATQAP